MTDLLPAATNGILLPADIDQVQAAMAAYLETTKAVLEPSDWQGPPDQPGSFIKKSGWQKIAKAYRLSTEVVEQTADRDDDGQLLRAGAVMRAIAPNGQWREATGYCDITEPRFATQGGRHKLENDLRNTAATRAENRAISNLCGLGAVSAEEAEGGQPATVGHPPGSGGGLPAWAGPGDVPHAADLLSQILAAANVDQPEVVVNAVGNQLFGQCNESIPRIVVDTLALIAAHIPEPIPEVEVQP
jgi:hypothetical protein